MVCGDESDEIAHVMVAGRSRIGTALNLSNWPGSSTAPALIGDTSAETVLRFLRRPVHGSADPLPDAVTSERFSSGSALALWALIHPIEAEELAPRLLAAARATEFGVTDSMETTKLVCALKVYADPDESPIAAALRGAEEPLRSSLLFRAVLPEVGGMLRNIRQYDLVWIGEYSDVLQSEALLNSGAVQLETVPDVDLVVVDTPLHLHPLVHLTATAGHSRVLTVRSENTFSLEYRYESWVQYRSYRPPPRVDLRRLATRLNMFERRDGRWRAEPVDAPTPTLCFDDGRDGPSPSSLARETAVEEMLDFLREHHADPALLWSPYG
ncbi:MAG: DUF6687 family protein [Dehalococcoidia bacterium]